MWNRMFCRRRDYFLFTLLMAQTALGGFPAIAQTKITFDSYKQQCLTKVQQSGIKGDLANDICNCTISTFKKQYKLDEFSRVVQKSKTDKAVAKKLADVGEACFEKYLYE